MSEVVDLFCLDLPPSLNLRVNDESGNLVLEEDPIVLDMIFADCRENNSLKTTTEKIDWIKDITKTLNDRYGTSLTFHHTTMIVTQVGKILDSLKKSVNGSPESPTSSPESSDPSPQESST